MAAVNFELLSGDYSDKELCFHWAEDTRLQISPAVARRIHRTKTVRENVEVGVPQGSCLGPLLFLAYINDLPQAVLDSNVSMYADDTSLC